MAIAFSYGSRFLVPTSDQLATLRTTTVVPVTAPVSAPQPVAVKIVAPTVSTVLPYPRPAVVAPYTPLITAAPVAVAAPSAPTLTAHTFETCSSCGGETVADIEAAAPAAPAPSTPAPAPTAPAPAPATPTAPKKKSVAGWVALAALLVIGGGLILGAVTRPRR